MNLNQSKVKVTVEPHLFRHGPVCVDRDLLWCRGSGRADGSGCWHSFLALRSCSLLQGRAVFSAPGTDLRNGGGVPAVGGCERGTGVVCADGSRLNVVHSDWRRWHRLRAADFGR